MLVDLALSPLRSVMRIKYYMYKPVVDRHDPCVEKERLGFRISISLV